MNAWDNLVNAKHIDFVIESVKKYSDEWAMSCNAVMSVSYPAAYSAAWEVSYNAARNAARDAAWGAIYYEAMNVSYNTARDAVWGAAYYAALDAILALVVYDDCEQYLDMSYNELLVMAKLTEIPATILLLPYAKAMELINPQLNSTVF